MGRMVRGTETTAVKLCSNACAGPMPAAQSTLNYSWYY